MQRAQLALVQPHACSYVLHGDGLQGIDRGEEDGTRLTRMFVTSSFMSPSLPLARSQSFSSACMNSRNCG